MSPGADDAEAEQAEIPRLSPSSLYNLLKPSPCDLREWLKSHDYEEEPPDAFRELLFSLGNQHEDQHLTLFPEALDIAELPRQQQTEATINALRAGERVIYQGRLSARTTLGGREVKIVGHPDFMLPAGSGHTIRDSKLNRSLNDYVEMQLLTYGWLYEQTTGEPPVALQVHSGSDEILDLPYEGATAALALFERMVELRFTDERPVEHIGVAKCSGCGFRAHCWPQAIERQDVGLLPGLDRGLIDELHGRGVDTIEQLAERFDAESLAALERPRGSRMSRVGDRADRILRAAEAHLRGEPILLGPPNLPDAKTWVMFDLEGMQPGFDELEKIYMWGLQCFGEEAGPFRPALAGFGPEGDREGWHAFLGECEAIFAEHGDLPFVHWANYEKTKIDLYVSRYGDPNGTASRVKSNLLDLLPITRQAVAVPLSGYGLKQIETLAGYERTLEESGGNWAMARYIEATECEDEAKRAGIMNEILAYNREDLEAMWAALEWLRGLAR
jgi:predicted RecB family nuclease